MSTKTAQRVTAEIRQTGKSERKIVCPYGHEWSASAGDYFMCKHDHALTCHHEGIDMPCDLIEKVFINGTDKEGRTFYGTAWVTLVEGVTVADL